jgi:prolyl-tRNA synthetase
MRLSKLFLPIIKENPSEASVISHKLMLRAGMIRQLTSGIYNWLPLGKMVLDNIANIIRTELNNSDCQEIIMPTIQPASLWVESERYDGYGKEMLRITDRHDNEMLYGPTAEEVVTDIFRNNISSYKQLPKTLYQINWKFRDEIRPRFGVMRGREFLMKDAYSFNLSVADAHQTYHNMYKTYLHIFKKMGLTAIPVTADTGPIGGNLSHEFHVIADTGESEIYFDKKLNNTNLSVQEMMNLYAAADEKHDPSTCPIAADELMQKRGIEVGHIFYLGQKYSQILNARIADNNGNLIHPEMGCYGIGVSRLVAAAIEANHDENGIIWPEEIAPFKVAIINLKIDDTSCIQASEYLYNKFHANHISCLLDDSDERAGSKFATNDLIGTPWQIIVGPKNIINGQVELKDRRSGEKLILSTEEALSRLIKKLHHGN